MAIQIIDFETTGLGTKEIPAQPIQFGTLLLNNDFELIYDEEIIIKPTISIEYGAMGIHGITPEYVNKHWDTRYEDIVRNGTNFIDEDTKYLVSHNTAYDCKFVDAKELSNVKIICTLQLARKLIDKKDCQDHKNSTLYHYFGCYKDTLFKQFIGKTHSALSDAAMTANVLIAILKEFDLTIEDAYNLLQDKPLNEICYFRKYKGTPWKEVVEKDIDYCHWILNAGLITDEKLINYLKELMRV